MPSKPEENGTPLLDVEPRDVERGRFEDDVALHPPPPKPITGAGRKFLIWTAINMSATIGIVFTNKAIFNDPAFKMMQTSFASFHFVCTGLTLYIVSRKSIGAFVPKRAGLVEMLPVSREISHVQLLFSGKYC
jgi:solute carrier family 35 protein E3